MIYGLTYDGKTCKLLTKSKFLRDLLCDTRKQPQLADCSIYEAKFMLKHAWGLSTSESLQEFVEEEDFTVFRKFYLKRVSHNSLVAELEESIGDILHEKTSCLKVQYELPDDVDQSTWTYAKIDITYPAIQEFHEKVQTVLRELAESLTLYGELGLSFEELVAVYHSELRGFSV